MSTMQTPMMESGFQPVASDTTENREALFHELVDIWRRETGVLSSIEDKTMHWSYQQIIGMGRDAVPLILRELEERPSHWTWALKAITRENPIRPESIGNAKRIAADWLAWGEARGYV